jgi:NAD(P)-dependent dehydrogenase (short-subunit alcohol dehydrogenase family)
MILQDKVALVTGGTSLMKKMILIALVGTGFIVTMPFTAQALDPEKIGHNLDREPNMSIAQYDRDIDRDRDRDYQYGDDRRSRPFTVSYRSSDDRRWIFDSVHYSRRDARRAANRLERRGYRTLILG